MSERVYEMLWDCAYCGTRKLLGKTHRFCPKCGAPQDAERRYFPSEDEKVAVEDHEYAGADRACPACESAMSAKALHCTQCGSPLEGAREVRRVDALPPPAPAPLAAAKPGRGMASCLLPALGLVVLLVAGVLVTAFWKRDAQAEVAEASWERSVAVESLAPVQESAWCDSLPRAAYSVSRRREVRSHRRVEAGEDCRTVNVDRGDGTFSQRRECTPRYREEPVYDLRCVFTIDRWSESRREVARGGAGGAPPSWPALSLRGGDCRGCEREGRRTTSYKVVLQAGSRRFTCDVPEARWASFTQGSKWAYKVGVVTGSPDCGSLTPLPRGS
jgi:hypothetical protein